MNATTKKSGPRGLEQHNDMKMLINATQTDELRVAIVSGKRLYDLDIESATAQLKKSNIYKGKISSIEPSLGAVFVDYGCERHGFLPLREISKEYFISTPDNLENIDLKQVLKIGQELVVQIVKEERDAKGAALTTFISLAGAYLVLMPNNAKASGVSRRIDDSNRERIRQALSQLELPEGMGVIIRTAGINKTVDELAWDLKFLLQFWNAIKMAAIAKPGPYLIHQESDVIIRAIRDYMRPDIKQIIVDTPLAYERAGAYLDQVRPDCRDKLSLYQGDMPLFSHYTIEQQIESAYCREVRLPSGGSIMIDITEAMICIDINSARATKGSNIEETAFNTNMEAVDEIARQLRIRDIGGLIVIDFIDMTCKQHCAQVRERMEQVTWTDRAKVQVGVISEFCLLEMSRQRLRTSLTRMIQAPCPSCSGSGMIRGVESVALSIIHLLEEHLATQNHLHSLEVQAPLEIATFLSNEKRCTIAAIEARSQVAIVIIPNEHLQTPNYQIKTTQLGSTRQKLSHRIAKIQNPDNQHRRKTATVQRTDEEPIVSQFLTQPSTRCEPSYRRILTLLKKILLWFCPHKNSCAPTAKKRSVTDKRGKQKADEKKKQPSEPRRNNTQNSPSAQRSNRSNKRNHSASKKAQAQETKETNTANAVAQEERNNKQSQGVQAKKTDHADSAKQPEARARNKHAANQHHPNEPTPQADALVNHSAPVEETTQPPTVASNMVSAAKPVVPPSSLKQVTTVEKEENA